MIKLTKQVQTILLIIVTFILLSGSYSGLKVLSSIGSYSTGYQGARAQYSGINYKSQQYTNTIKHEASRCRFDTTLSFDPDNSQQYMPNLDGEMTSVFVPSESLGNFPDWIPSDWQRSISYMTNPKSQWEWEMENKTYRMEEWILRWYFSISAEWDEHLFGHWVTEAEWHDQRLTDCEVWFQIDLTPVWYFEGAERAYFAIAKMQLAEVKLDARDNQGNLVEAEKAVSVKPQSQGSILPVYYGEFAKSSDATKTVSSYQGKQLNPDLFTDTVYTYVTLENFGTWAWTEYTPFPQWRYKGDVVTMAVDVHVFVIGQWDVKDIESLEEYEDYGRTAKVGGAGFSIGDWFSLPENRLLLLLLAGFFVFLVLAILAPAVLISIMAIFGSGRRKS